MYQCLYLITTWTSGRCGVEETLKEERDGTGEIASSALGDHFRQRYKSSKTKQDREEASDWGSHDVMSEAPHP